jgi:hypothetical protein
MMNAKSTQKFQDHIASLEELMVKQFRGLQALAQITIRERAALAKNDSDGLILLASDKESVLEDIGIIGDSLHMVFEEIGKTIEMQKMLSLNEDLLPRLEAIPAERLSRLRDGIMTLYDEVHQLSLANKAIARNNQSDPDLSQAYLLNDFFSPEIYDTYRQPPAEENSRPS